MSVTQAGRESLGYLSYKAVKEAEARKKAAESGEDPKKTEELTEEQKKTAEEIAAYKKEFLSTVESMVGSPMLSNMEVRLKISDAGYASMLADPEYEQEVIDALRKEVLANYDSSAKTITLTANGQTYSAAKTAGSSGSSATDGVAKLSTQQLRRGAGIDALNQRVLEVIAARFGADSELAADLDPGTVVKGGGTGKGSSILDSYQHRRGLLDYNA